MPFFHFTEPMSKDEVYVTFYTKSEVTVLTRQQWLNIDDYLGPPLHRIDGPAVLYANGTKEWFINGRRHRIDGPAIEFNGGGKLWFINGRQINGIEVETWIKKHGIDLSTEEGQIAFKITWC